MLKELQSTLSHGVIPNLDLLPNTGEPLIIISNHTFSGNQLPAIRKIHQKRKDLSVVCNAGFSPFLTLVGIDTIPVKSLNHKGDKNIIRNLWSKLIVLSGELSGISDKSKDGMSLIESIVNKLSVGGSVWLTPSGKQESLNNQSPWKRGLDYSLRECLDREVDPYIAMLYISQFTQSDILEISKASELSLIKLHNPPMSLQRHYWNSVSSLA